MNEHQRRKKQIQDSEKIAMGAVGVFIVIVLVLSVINLFS